MKTSKNFWKNKSKEEILNKAREYKIPSDFYSNCIGCYEIAKENNWLEEVFDIRRVLTYDVCKTEVSKYNTYSELFNSDRSVLMKINDKGWNELINHFEIPFSNRNPKWTYEACKEEISKMVYLKDLQGTSVLNAIKNNGWYDELTKNLIRKQRKPYTYDEIINEALKYQTRGEFQKKSSSMYSAALKKNIIDDVCKHMKKSLNEKRYTKEEILESAKKYNNQRDWLKNEPSIFNSAVGYKNNTKNKDIEFWEKCISHMEYIFKPNGYWTYERCKEAVSKYEYLNDLSNSKHSHAYNAILKNGWNVLLVDLKLKRKPTGYWTYERCKEEALKFSKRSDFSNAKDGSCTAYHKILENGWEELLSHMKIQRTLKEREIYAYEFPENKTVYIGLTHNIKRRNREHSGLDKRYGKINSPVYHFSKKTGEVPILKILTKKPVKEKNAPKSESYFIEKYKNNGWILLNKAKAGGLGSKQLKWTKNNIKKITDECKTDSELRKRLPSWVIYTMKKNDWWNELTSHIVYDGVTIWTEEKVFEILPDMKNISEIQKKYSGATKFINRNSHVLEKVKKYFDSQNKLYNKEDIIDIVKSYTCISSFKKKHRKLYKISVDNGWIKEMKVHLKPLVRKEIWTYEKCKEVALNYKSKWELGKNSKACYSKIHKEGWLGLISHMPKRNLSYLKEYNGKYTKEKIIEISKHCKNKSELQEKYSGVYKAAKKLKIINEIFEKK
jgi:hypothetical protein